MSNDEKRLAALEYHMELLVKQMDPKKYPLDYLIIEKKLTREDANEIHQTCEELSNEMKRQKAEGFVTFSPLLKLFEQALPPVLKVEETISALLKQGKYTSLMLEFQKLKKK
jgi:hypothetical protein